MTVVLDTSALLAHHRDEEGVDGVQSLFEDANIELLIASVTLMYLVVPRVCSSKVL
jgi:PIN domain nuclease of toxin-antitoxin system